MRYEVIPHFLTDAECDKLIELARPRMSKAQVWDSQAGIQLEQDHHRRAELAWIRMHENDFVKEIELRIQEKTGVPFTHGEQLQVSHYNVGGYFKEHFDAHDPNAPANQMLFADGGQRIKTFMIYLNDVEEGGETYFPQAGKNFAPTKGAALLWDDVDPSGGIDQSTLHSAEPVLKGEKWIVTKWLHEKPRQEGLNLLNAQQQQQQPMVVQTEPPKIGRPAPQRLLEAEAGETPTIMRPTENLITSANIKPIVYNMGGGKVKLGFTSGL